MILWKDSDFSLICSLPKLPEKLATHSGSMSFVVNNQHALIVCIEVQVMIWQSIPVQSLSGFLCEFHSQS